MAEVSLDTQRMLWKRLMANGFYDYLIPADDKSLTAWQKSYFLVLMLERIRKLRLGKSANADDIKRLASTCINEIKKQGFVKRHKTYLHFKDLSPRYKKLFNAHCYFCGHEDVIHLHHIVPRKCKGEDEESNLLPLCPNHHSLIHLRNFKLKYNRGKYFLKGDQTYKRPFVSQQHIKRDFPIVACYKTISEVLGIEIVEL